ncbi:hypothetical protein DI09_5p290 [Mitosporidium daphniae]|uniref:Uncharacterized protein n=1 Tax=Mitosporidium daphniae TaxID=1485682 RepID=A0A098VNM4_9MICR|nr:uncharacterized protein DI09_5p290 [Mitosporidium daphniae]KGG50682.1 hypothetical protein DI09_5p290 [Mitosporidium daphniae]|eukprot:XP_013237109.1 uncharacterized protein DI09_5p290 [Mitosporidium daphniae]
MHKPFQKHASSTHEFVQRAIARIRLGHPKPLWFDTVVQVYPPLAPFMLSSEQRAPFPTNSDENMHKPTDDPCDDPCDRIIRKKKNQLSKEEREMLNWRHLFPPKWDHQPLPKIQTPQDTPIRQLFERYPFEATRSAMDPISPVKFPAISVDETGAHIDTIDNVHPGGIPSLLEDKLARECAIATNAISSTIEQSSVKFAELEMSAPQPNPNPRRKDRRRVRREKFSE